MDVALTPDHSPTLDEDALAPAVDPLQRVTQAPIFEQLCGRWPEEMGPAERLQLATCSTGISLALVGLYGAAVGGSDPLFAAKTALKLPIITVLGVATTLPAGALVWKLTDARSSLTHLLSGLAAGHLGMGLTLAVLAPIVALYTRTTVYAGAGLAIAGFALAATIGALVATRALVPYRGELFPPLRSTLPFFAMVGVYLASIEQFVDLAGGVLPPTTFYARHVLGLP